MNPTIAPVYELAQGIKMWTKEFTVSDEYHIKKCIFGVQTIYSGKPFYFYTPTSDDVKLALLDPTSLWF